MAKIDEIIKQRILILDGAMGTMIQAYGLSEDDFWTDDLRRSMPSLKRPAQMQGNNDVLNLTRPDIIRDIHRRYLDAGADIIETNTFSSQRISQADYALEGYARDMALQGARIARALADRYSTPEKPRFVAGSVGPTNKTCSMSPDVSNPAKRDLTYRQLLEAYEEQMDGLLEGGVDALLIETIFDTLNAKAALDAAMMVMRRRGIRVPLMLSVTISDLGGRTLSGQTLDAFLASVSGYDLFSVGLNCSFGAPQMKPYLQELAKISPYYISAYPNAGLPNSMGLYDETADSMAPQIGELADEGLVNIVGGCCGTTDEFIRRYVALVEGKKPHQLNAPSRQMVLSGLDLLRVESPQLLSDSSQSAPMSTFINVGERCNVAGSRKFLRLIQEKNYDEALAIARKQVADGALVIDVNMDDALLDARQEMVTFLNLVASEPDVARVPVMIDSSKWEVIVAGLECCQGKCIVNSISLKEGEEVFLAHARDVKRFGAAVVVMCFDEQGQATTYERRIEIAARAYRLLTEKAGIHPLDIIFDPNILSIATGIEEHDNYAVDFIRATRWIRTHLRGAHVSGGVSNLSFSFRGNNYIREAMHAVFLYHAMQAGMDFGIVNPATKVAYADLPADQLRIIEDVVLNRRKDAAEDLVALAGRIKAEQERAKAVGVAAAGMAPTQACGEEQWRQLPLDARLAYALRKGISTHLHDDLAEALQQYPRAVDIIEGPLMAGMNEVGDLFGQGKMFLPQVVKTARTMKQAVSILQPHIEATRQSGTSSAGRVLLATVKGDVHDIGKNIVAVVMACNNYEVIDMGVMVPADHIVKKAIEVNADMVGLSGLITPSLEEMVNVATEMQQAGLEIPIMIGGATTSKLYVALRIATVYDGPVVWMKDAAQNVRAASRLMERSERVAFKAELDRQYQEMRQNYQQKQQELLALEEARKHKLNLFDEPTEQKK